MHGAGRRVDPPPKPPTHPNNSMLASELYGDVYRLASRVRAEYGGFASTETHARVQDATWILNNLHALPESDIALLAEYNRNVQEHVVERLRRIVCLGRG